MVRRRRRGLASLPGLWSAARRSVRRRLARVHPAPIFVLGNQKSGTTAIAALLGEMTSHAVSLDLQHDIAHPATDQVFTGGMTLETFIDLNRIDFARAIIKEPNLTPLYPMLARRFPKARFVFIVREPGQNIRSILNRLKIAGDLANDPPPDPAMLPGWRLVMDGSWLGIEADHYIDRLALRWRALAELYLEAADDMLLCRYEDFTADKVGVLRRLAARLDLDECRDITSRVDVQFQPAGDRSVTPLEFFGADNLARIERICGGTMTRLGYE